VPLSLSRSARKSAARRLALTVLALAAVLATTSCKDVGSPYDCSWADTPEGITAEDLAGDYEASTGTGTFHLGEDGTFTTTGFSYSDWLSGATLSFKGDGRWHDVAADRWAVPYVDVPFVEAAEPTVDHITLAVARGHLNMSVGGSRERPVIYTTDPLKKDTCDAYSSMFRKARSV
jgi:hypothetical protein